MRIGILGTGGVGQALARGFVACGHEVWIGGREAQKASDFAAECGDRVHACDFEEAAREGELLLVCTLGTAIVDAVERAGVAHFDGKVVIDTTNPLDFSAGFPPRLAWGGPGSEQGSSGGERLQAAIPGARVVKAFNTVGNSLMFRPSLPHGPPTMFICGNDPAAKQTVRGILEEWGWESMDAGGIEAAHLLEAMCILWVRTASQTGVWNQAFKMLRPV